MDILVHIGCLLFMAVKRGGTATTNSKTRERGVILDANSMFISVSTLGAYRNSTGVLHSNTAFGLYLKCIINLDCASCPRY